MYGRRPGDHPRIRTLLSKALCSGQSSEARQGPENRRSVGGTRNESHWASGAWASGNWELEEGTFTSVFILHIAFEEK